MTLESAYQADLRQRLEQEIFPGSIVLKNDTRYRQGIPDLVIFYRDRYAFLEVKKSAKEPFQPNQEWYLELINGMSFSAVIYPENEREVIAALQRSFQARRHARVSQR